MLPPLYHPSDKIVRLPESWRNQLLVTYRSGVSSSQTCGSPSGSSLCARKSFLRFVFLLKGKRGPLGVRRGCPQPVRSGTVKGTKIHSTHKLTTQSAQVHTHACTHSHTRAHTHKKESSEGRKIQPCYGRRPPGSNLHQRLRSRVSSGWHHGEPRARELWRLTLRSAFCGESAPSPGGRRFPSSRGRRPACGPGVPAKPCGKERKAFIFSSWVSLDLPGGNAVSSPRALSCALSKAWKGRTRGVQGRVFSAAWAPGAPARAGPLLKLCCQLRLICLMTCSLLFPFLHFGEFLTPKKQSLKQSGKRRQPFGSAALGSWAAGTTQGVEGVGSPQELPLGCLPGACRGSPAPGCWPLGPGWPTARWRWCGPVFPSSRPRYSTSPRALLRLCFLEDSGLDHALCDLRNTCTKIILDTSF